MIAVGCCCVLMVAVLGDCVVLPVACCALLFCVCCLLFVSCVLFDCCVVKVVAVVGSFMFGVCCALRCLLFVVFVCCSVVFAVCSLLCVV